MRGEGRTESGELSPTGWQSFMVFLSLSSWADDFSPTGHRVFNPTKVPTT
jgi:hypothetical protein